LLFEKFNSVAHPDPGRPVKIELQNADWRGGLETGRPDFILADLLSRMANPLAPILF
jgi:hypothetical protein